MVQGLEGRSDNPVSLLMDTLNHPCADLGLELPSLLEWHHHPECQVDHIVLGKGPPGGSWQVMSFVLLIKKQVNLYFLDFSLTCYQLTSPRHCQPLCPNIRIICLRQW